MDLPAPASDTPSQPESAPHVPQTPPKSVMKGVSKKASNNNALGDGLPTEEAVHEKTLEDEPNPQEVGENTEQLSEVTDAEDDNDKKTASKNALSTWYRRIQPLIRNKRVRAFAIVNAILTLINLLVFLGCMVMIGLLIAEMTSVNERTSKDKPCIYQWSEWGRCNETCRASLDSPIPQKNRTVIKDSIIQARGSKYKKCDEKLADKLDFAPCNTHQCPRPLSSFEFTGNCVYKSMTAHEQGCHEMRDLPLGDYLIEIDTLELSRNCSCPDVASTPDAKE